MNERIKELREDVADDKKSVLQAIQEVADAQAWLNKMEHNYADSVIRLEKAIKESQV